MLASSGRDIYSVMLFEISLCRWQSTKAYAGRCVTWAGHSNTWRCLLILAITRCFEETALQTRDRKAMSVRSRLQNRGCKPDTPVGEKRFLSAWVLGHAVLLDLAAGAEICSACRV
jgi:hypothetical protein